MKQYFLAGNKPFASGLRLAAAALGFVFLASCGKDGGYKIISSLPEGSVSKLKRAAARIAKKSGFSSDNAPWKSERNPFLTAVEEKKFQDELGRRDIVEISGALTLSAVFYSPYSSSYAVINGRVLRERDKIDGKEIVKISGEDVFLKDSEGKEYFVKVKRISAR